MKTLATNPTTVLNQRKGFLRTILSVSLMLPGFALPQSPAPINLGSTANFAVLAGSLVSDIPTSMITGDVGLSPAADSYITGLGSTEVTGTIYTVDAQGPAGSVPDATRLIAAKGDLNKVFNDAAGRKPIPTGSFLNPGSGDLAGLNLVPGIYKFTGAALISSNVTLTGGDTSVWIFQIGYSLTAGNGIHIVLAGGAKAANIFWQVGTSATIGTAADFKGTIMAEQSITLARGARLDGRALARLAAVTLSANTITVPVIAPVQLASVHGALNVPIFTSLRWANSLCTASCRAQLSTDSTLAPLWSMTPR